VLHPQLPALAEVRDGLAKVVVPIIALLAVEIIDLLAIQVVQNISTRSR
jgi:hypothetical protein